MSFPEAELMWIPDLGISASKTELNKPIFLIKYLPSGIPL
jgi:hypothetical protein